MILIWLLSEYSYDSHMQDLSYENHMYITSYDSHMYDHMILIWFATYDSHMIVYTYDSHMIHIWSSYERQCICGSYVAKLPMYTVKSDTV